MKCSLDIAKFLEEISSFPFYCFPLFLCIAHFKKLSYLSLLFFGTLHSNGYIFSFLLCLSLLFFSQLFVRPPQTTFLPFCISLSWGWSWSLPSVQCHGPPSLVSGTLSDLIPWIYLLLLLLLLLSRFSRVQLCATPEMAAHQAPPSLGFSRQEHWSGLPFPSPMHESEKWKWSRSVVSNP